MLRSLAVGAVLVTIVGSFAVASQKSSVYSWKRTRAPHKPMSA